MKVFRCTYIPHTKEPHPEALSYLFGYLTKEENEAYQKHCKHSAAMGADFINHLLSKDDEDDRLTDEDIYYYLTEGLDKGEALSAIGLDPDTFIGRPHQGDLYRGLVYNDDLTVIINEVYSNE